jgi:hypothetical protein
MAYSEMEPSSKTKNFQIYGDNKRRMIKTSDLDQMLPKMYSKFAMTNTPIFYGFRHRFRTDMLDAELPETEINYLMGHESQGFEAWNVFREESFNDPKLYLQAASSIGSDAENYHNTSRFSTSQKRANGAKSIPLDVCSIHHRKQK